MYNELSKKIDKYLQNRGEYDLPKSLRMAWINEIPSKDATNDEAIIAKIGELLNTSDGKQAFFDYFLGEYKNLLTKESKTYEECRILDVAANLLKEVAFCTEETVNIPQPQDIEKDAPAEIQETDDSATEEIETKTEEAQEETASEEAALVEPEEKPKKATRTRKTAKAADKKTESASTKRGKKAGEKTVKAPSATAKKEKATKTAKASATGAKRGRKPKADKQ